MKDSKKTQVLFDKAIDEIANVLNSGDIPDKSYMDVVLKTFLGHIKIKNYEIREDALRFVVTKNLSENIQELKTVLPKTLPEYVGT